MTADPNVQLMAFFVATAISIVAAHMGLVRLIGTPQTAIERERQGVLIVVEFALVVLILAPTPIAAKLLGFDDPFFGPALGVPVSILVLVIVDRKKKREGQDSYYRGVANTVMAVSVALIAVALAVKFWLPRMVTLWPPLQNVTNAFTFFLGLFVALLILAAQFLKSAWRFAKPPASEATQAMSVIAAALKAAEAATQAADTAKAAAEAATQAANAVKVAAQALAEKVPVAPQT
jgi:hypothetical protein